MPVNFNKNPDAFNQMRGLSADKLQDFAEVMTHDAREGSPFDTGHNKRSIDFEVLPDIQFAAGFGFRVFTESGYGAYLDLGTARIPARPYFRRAFETARIQVLS
ncbi:hypothetical protein LCGC14_1105540 [marine sediment metagenome]|uniref:Uncharacterized protein n=1 Tax=marine sediment metagenome TaxID=412755 RepID=A0A0F9M880_9ZZZZ